MKIAILGFGREGKAVLKFLKRNKIDDEIWILDKDLKIKIPSGVKTRIGKNYLDNLNSFGIIFRSPGVPYNLPQIQRAIKGGVKFSSATKIFFGKAKGTIIGVTGTKGKGTTATLIYKILKTAYPKRVFLVGNIGKPCLDILPKLNKNSIIVFELSSFQLQDLNKSSQIAVVLDIFPDHLDKHKNLKEYLEAKANIAKYQKPKDKIFYFSDNRYSRIIAAKSKASKIPVSIESRVSFVIADLKIRGPHNFKNVLMAAAVAKHFGVNDAAIKKAVSSFRGLEHRLEFIGKINGVSIYNDSASTNPESAAMAISSFSKPQILIAGGKDKNLNYQPLTNIIRRSSVKAVLLYGENKNKIKAALKNLILVKIVPNLKCALERALKMAYNNDVIVFSPASASFDMFKDYQDRGEIFKSLVKKILRDPV